MDDHGHGHSHRRSWWSSLRHLLVPHGHDTVDRIDSAMEADRRGLHALFWSFAVLFGTSLLQLGLGALSGSVALFSDTIHNAGDALTAVPLGIAFLLARRAASRRYTYGLGRAEDLAGVLILVIIAGSAVLAGWEAVRRLLHPYPVTHLWAVVIAGVIGFAGNELVARYRITVGRQIGSAALVADGVHARTDGFTSLAVVLGAAGIAIGIPIADPIIGLGITVAIVLGLRTAAREVFLRLMDAIDPATIELAERTAATADEVEEVTDIRMRWIGHTLHAELSVTVDATLTVAEAHNVAHDVEHRLLHAMPRLSTATVHTEPSLGANHAHHKLAHHRSAH